VSKDSYLIESGDMYPSSPAPEGSYLVESEVVYPGSPAPEFKDGLNVTYTNQRCSIFLYAIKTQLSG